MKQNKDYEFIPAVEIDDNEQAWDIRILTGEFVESVIRFGNVAINEEIGNITFNYVIISSPVDDLSIDNTELQNVAGQILQDVIECSLEDGTAVIEERDNVQQSE